MKYSLPLLLLLFLSCSEDDIISEGPATVLMSISGVENLSTNDREHWIIISDHLGVELNSSELTQDSTFSTQRPLGPYINVSLLEVIGGNTYRIRTYTEVKAGSEWDISGFINVGNPANKSSSIVVVDANVDINHNFYIPTVSNAYGGVFNNGSNSTGFRGTDFIINFEVEESKPEDALLVINDGIQDPRYIWMTDAVLSKNLVLDYERDLQLMDHVLTYSFDALKGVYLDVTAFREDNKVFQALDGHIQTELFIRSDKLLHQSAFKLGYLDGFDYHITRMSLSLGEKVYHYEKYGNPPEVFDVSLFDNAFEVVNTDFSTFTYTSSGGFDVVEGIWRLDTGKNSVWSVFYPLQKDDDNLILTELPDNIQAQYPDLNLQNLNWQGDIAINVLNNGGYEQFISHTFRNSEKPAEYEFYRVVGSN